jgi:uncharacterized membrane protein YfcA
MMHGTIALTLLVFAAALLYSSVGHAGASGYLAAMALVGVAPEVMKPAALLLNIIVATIATAQFYRRGCFSWRTWWPFVVGSIPLAFVGGAIQLPGHIYKPIVGAVLLFAAARLVYATFTRSTTPQRDVRVWVAIVLGGAIGLLSGLTGTGGGIFLTPLLLLRGWSQTREAAGVSAAFILANSISGLAGNLASLRHLPAEVGILAVAAGFGGLIGSALGSRTLAPATLRYLLAAVLLIAGCKLILLV